MRLARWLVVAGSLILAATALFHATGYRDVTGAIQASGAPPFLVSAVKALWLMFSVHLLVLSLVFLAASRIPGGRRVVLLAAMIPLADTALLLRFAGVFVGTISLALATMLFLLGGVLLPPCAGVRGNGAQPES
jgi:hypothetical protein